MPFIILAWFQLLVYALGAPGEGPVRLFVPVSPMRGAFSKALGQAVEEFNKRPGVVPIQILARGADFSSLNDLMVSAVSQDAPELALVEIGEAATPELSKIALPLPPIWKEQIKQVLTQEDRTWFSRETRAVPWLAFKPVLLMDQEILFRLRLPIEPQVASLPSLVSLSETIARGIEGPRLGIPDFSAVAIALQGARGVLLLEALFGERLDHPAALAPELEALRSLFTKNLARGGMTYEQSLLAFITRRASLLVTASDSLPHLADDLYFRNRAIPIWDSKTTGFGFAIVATKTTPATWEALRYLMDRKVRETLAQASGAAVATVRLAPSRPWRMRARAEWQRVLPDLFGDAAQRQPLEVVLEALEHRLQKLRKS